MRTFTRTSALVAAVSLALAVVTAPAAAHNAGYLLIGGRCVPVGSGAEAPFVGAGAPQSDLGQLDLIVDPRNGADLSDQYGARWAATRGATPILPGDCPS
jgi:hypothetical protein